MTNKSKTQDICIIGVSAAMIAVLSWIYIPMPFGIPTTLQTFAVPFAGVILGPKKGTITVCTYILTGVVGLPVFAGFTGGIGALFGISGGYIWGFPLMAFCAGLGAKKGTALSIVLGLFMGIILDYTLGMLQFMYVSGHTLRESFFIAVIPFMPIEAIKATLAGSAGMKFRRVLVKSTLVTK